MITPAEMRQMLRRVLELALDSGTATGGTSTTLEDATKAWGTDIWREGIVEIVAGTGVGQIRKITANTGTTLTVTPAWVTIPDTTSLYAIRLPGIRATDVTDRAGRVLGQLTDGTNPVSPTDFGLPVKDVITHLSAYTLAAGGTVEVDIGPRTDRTGMGIMLRCTYDPAATAGVRIRWLYSHDGVSFDTPEDADAEGNYFEPTFVAGATRQRSTVIAFVSPYVRLSLVNLDPTYAVTVDHLTTVEVK